MIGRMVNMLGSRRGASSVEYGLVAAMIAVSTMVAVEFVGGNLSEVLDGSGGGVAAATLVAKNGYGGGTTTGGGEQQGDDGQAFLMFADVTDAERGSAQRTAMVIVPAWADGKEATLTGDPSCGIALDMVDVPAPARLGGGNILELTATAASEPNTTISCSIEVGSDHTTWKVTTAVADDFDPDTFAFADTYDVETGSEVFSDAVAMTGFTGDLVVFLDGDPDASLIINGIDQGGPVGVIQANDVVKVRTIAPFDPYTAKFVLVNIGSSSSAWLLMTGDH